MVTESLMRGTRGSPLIGDWLLPPSRAGRAGSKNSRRSSRATTTWDSWDDNDDGRKIREMGQRFLVTRNCPRIVRVPVDSWNLPEGSLFLVDPLFSFVGLVYCVSFFPFSGSLAFVVFVLSLPRFRWLAVRSLPTLPACDVKRLLYDSRLV